MDEMDFAAEYYRAFTQASLAAILAAPRQPSTGVCRSCGEVIAPQRRKAHPHACHCHDCAEEIEHLHQYERRRGPR